jgi:2-polyprenyl-3-methyl-5-hydroxy-6-metoxy-1,4-benzoquinol methylase
MTQNQSKISELNSNFYNSIAESFSRSRVKPWKGWESLHKYIIGGKSLADLGCGDGRFLGYLLSQDIQCNYTGYDISENLLTKAKESFPIAHFIKSDTTLDKLTTNYDVICIFGMLHHLENVLSVNSFLNSAINNINEDGYLIITFWQFDPAKEKTFNSKARELGVLLQENDYLLDWGGSGEYLRFCHLYTKEEIQIVKDNLRQHGLLLVEEFNADKANLYLIFRKQN